MMRFRKFNYKEKFRICVLATKLYFQFSVVFCNATNITKRISKINKEARYVEKLSYKLKRIKFIIYSPLPFKAFNLLAIKSRSVIPIMKDV